MKTLDITNANIRINENCHIIDRGIVKIANIIISEGVRVEYCFIAPSISVIVNDEAIRIPALSPNAIKKYYRHISIGSSTIFTGTGVIMNETDIEIITEIV